MEEREQREMAREQRADVDTGDNDAPGGSRNMTANGRSTVNRGETEAMEVDGPPAGEVNISSERLEAFSSALGKYRHAQHIEQMPIADIEGVVNGGAAKPYSASEIMSLLKIMEEKGILMIRKDMNLVYFV